MLLTLEEVRFLLQKKCRFSETRIPHFHRDTNYLIQSTVIRYFIQKYPQKSVNENLIWALLSVHVCEMMNFVVFDTPLASLVLGQLLKSIKIKFDKSRDYVNTIGS